MAPPCSTFSRARRSDRFARLKRLRSEKHPEGVPGQKGNPRARKANELTRRCIRIARAQVRAGGWVSIENPEDSLIWQLQPMRSLARLLVKVLGDQCAFGGLWRKPTAWLTNAEWLQFLQRRCPGPPTHRHQPLVGKTCTHDGRVIWMTQLAAEYHEDLCTEIARQYKAVHEMPYQPGPAIVMETGNKMKKKACRKKPNGSEENARTQMPLEVYGCRSSPSRSCQNGKKSVYIWRAHSTK